MSRWANEDSFDAAVRTASSAHGVPVALIKAIIGKESQFRPNAYRAEVAIGDASRGLMQILLSTAGGEGYTGPAGDATKLTGLFAPATNIDYGTSYLASQLSRVKGDIRAAISAYNGGYRPSLGFGAVATKPLTICLARDSKGNCVQTRKVPIGEYSNQPYVNDVMSNLAYFEAKERSASTPVPSTIPGTTSPLSGGYRNTDESETDSRVSGTITRTHWSKIWEAIIKLCNLLLRR